MSRFFPLVLLLLIPRSTFAGELTDELPLVPEGFTVDVIATEPLVSNPCVMAFDRQGRLFVAQGYYDFATPFFAAEYALTRTGIPQDRVEYHYYDAGHMMYVRDEDRVKLSRDVREFIRRR